MDEKDRALYDAKYHYLEERVKALEANEARLNALEQWKASMMASAMKSAFVIGACSMTGAAIAVFLSHILKVFAK